jgi:hypothetical protein
MTNIAIALYTPRKTSVLLGLVRVAVVLAPAAAVVAAVLLALAL